MLRSAMMAGVVALSCVAVSQPADAQMHGPGGGGGWGGGWHGGSGWHGGGWGGGNNFFFSFGFPGFGFGAYPYYPAYYYPPYYPYYPPYRPYPPYPAVSSGTVTPGAPSATNTVDPATVRAIQAELQRGGYNVGPVDGRLGPRTRAAIREYERQNGLPIDGSPSRFLLDHMRADT